MKERTLLRRHTLEATVKAAGPLHVGGVSSHMADVDMTLARDGLGRVVIPGTSLAGALCSALAVMGRPTGVWGGDGADDGASLITVADAVAEGNPALETRPHTAIDRRTGTAAAGHLYSREVLAAGAVFKVKLTGEVFHEDEDKWVVNALRDTLKLLHSGIFLGASTTSGLGWLELVDQADSWKKTQEDFRSAEGLIAALSGGTAEPSFWTRPEDAEATPPPETVRFTIQWRPKGPLMSKTDDPGGICDVYPATTSDQDGLRLLLPGSSIKGALRTRGEHIIRVMTGRSDLPEAFLEQMKDSAALAAGSVGAIFGEAGDQEDVERNGRKGALSARDVRTWAVIPRDKWQALRRVERPSDKADRATKDREFSDLVQELNVALKDKEQPLWFCYAARNAIDRWSGGASDGALYSALEPYARNDMDSPWEPIVVDLDLQRLDQACKRKVSGLDPETAFGIALGVLLLTLKDLADGWVPLGFGAGRGLGSITVSAIDIAVNSTNKSSTLALLRELKTLSEVFDEPGNALRDMLRPALAQLPDQSVLRQETP